MLLSQHFEKRKPHHGLLLLLRTLFLQCAQKHLHVKISHIHPFLLSPVVAKLVIQPPSSRGPLCCQPAYASLHEAQRFLPGAHLLHQSPDVRLKNSLDDRRGKVSEMEGKLDVAFHEPIINFILLL